MRRLISCIVLLVLASRGHAQSLTAPKHVDAAHALVASLDVSRTQYRHGEQVVHWCEGDRPAEARCDCSGLLNALLTRAYGYGEADSKKWFGVERPLAAHYHDAIAKEIGFIRLRDVTSIQPGDILAVKYAQLASDKSTGHVMLVIDSPKPMSAKKPLVGETDQWRVAIVDSTKSPHGKSDSRMNEDGTKRDGVGRGDFRLYTDKGGDVVGYTWSTSTGSTFRERPTHSIVVGRLAPGFKP